MNKKKAFLFSTCIAAALSIVLAVSCSKPSKDPARTLPQGDLGEIFLQGKTLYDQKKYEEAFPFLEAAAEGGNPEAQMRLGKMYFNGWGVKHDHAKGREWHEKAAAQGNAESIEKLKKMSH
ncbi:MAG: sel1 repeat family protein [Spirochaetia bacterium]|nr:sel1 repeat family protein [Spirochaetia bacterium]